VRHPPENAGGGPHPYEPPAPQDPPAAKARGHLSILADRQRRARTRIRAEDEHRRVCRELEQLAPLVRYYGPRRPRPVPLAEFLAEGWWAA
jgi:hypothetical protein